MLPTLSLLSLAPRAAGAVRGAGALSLTPRRARLEAVTEKGGVTEREVCRGRDPSAVPTFIYHPVNPQRHRKYPALAAKPSGERGRKPASLRPSPPRVPRPHTPPAHESA